MFFKYLSIGFYCLSLNIVKRLNSRKRNVNMKNLDERPEVHLQDHWNFNVKYFKFIVRFPPGSRVELLSERRYATVREKTVSIFLGCGVQFGNVRLPAVSAPAGCRARVTMSISLSAPSDDRLTITTEIYAVDKANTANAFPSRTTFHPDRSIRRTSEIKERCQEIGLDDDEIYRVSWTWSVLLKYDRSICGSFYGVYCNFDAKKFRSRKKMEEWRNCPSNLLIIIHILNLETS